MKVALAPVDRSYRAFHFKSTHFRVISDIAISDFVENWYTCSLASKSVSM